MQGTFRSALRLATRKGMTKYLLPAVREWVEWPPVFNDAALWPSVARRIWAADAALRAATGIAAPTRIAAGYPGTCAVLIVDEAAVLKIFPPPLANDFARERAVYRLPGLTLPFAPALLAEGVLRDRVDWPYLVFSFLPGVAWRDALPAVPPDARAAIMNDLGRAIRAVHDAPLPDAGSWPSRAAWEPFLKQRLAQGPQELRLRTALPDGLIGDIEAILAGIEWHVAPPRLLHADLTEDHLLVDQEEGHWYISGLIDWADAEVGDPYYEWIALWFGLCRRRGELWRAFLDGYDPAWTAATPDIDRLTAFTFLHRFGTGILNDVLAPDEQRALSVLADLQRALFPGLLT